MHRTLLPIALLACSCSATHGADSLSVVHLTDADIIDPSADLEELAPAPLTEEIRHDLTSAHWLRGLGLARERGLDVALGELELHYVEVPCGHDEWSGCHRGDRIYLRVFLDQDGTETEMSQPGELIMLYHEYGHRRNGDAHEVGPYAWTIAGLIYEWSLTGDDNIALGMATAGALGTDMIGWWSNERYQLGSIAALRYYIECDGNPECALRAVSDASTEEIRQHLSLSDDDRNDGPCAMWQSLWFDLLGADGLPLDEHRRDLLRGFVLDAC